MTIATVRSGTGNAGRARQEVGTQGSGPGGLCREAGYDSALVSKTDCGKVRRFQAPVIPWAAAYQSGSGSADRQVRPREWELGLRSDRPCTQSLDHEVSDQTVGNVLRRRGIEPAPKRGQSASWSEFIRAHMEVLAGMDFFTVEVLTWRGLATYYVLFLIHLESRRITIAGMSRHPTQTWMEQMARNVTDESTGCLRDIRYVLHDRDTKFCASFESNLTAAGVKPLKLPARSPNLNAFAERWVRSVKAECLSKPILFGEAFLKRTLAEFVEHFHAERPHQGKGNVLLFPTQRLQQAADAQIVCRQRLGGLPRRSPKTGQ